jgi:hypothetical protein
MKFFSKSVNNSFPNASKQPRFFKQAKRTAKIHTFSYTQKQFLIFFDQLLSPQKEACAIAQAL